MNRKFWTVLIHTCIPYLLHAQHVPFFCSARHDVNSVTTNPALLRLGKGDWSTLLFSINGTVGSNTGSMSLKDLFNLNANFLRQNVLGTRDISTGYTVIDLRGPALAYGVTSKLNLAITSRTRLHSNYWQADGRLISEIGELVKVPQEYPYYMKREKMQMIASAFSEMAFSASYLLLQTENHSLSSGISIKVITGVANTSTSVPSLTGSIRRINSYLTSLTEATGEVTTRTSGDLFGDANLENIFSLGKISLGTSLGMVYEYFPSNKEPSKLRLSLSVTDIGKLRFKADTSYSKSYDINIPQSKDLYFNNNFNNSTFSQTTRVFDKYPEFFDNTGVEAGSYSVGLPSRIHVAADLRLNENLFVSTQAVLGLSKKNEITSLRENSTVYAAARWEKAHWAVGLSAGYQEFGGLSSGISLQAGPIFFSSSTLLSSTFSKSKQLHLSLGVVLPSSFLK